ncbi:MAG: phosphoglycerate mutase family protein [Bdellovibrionales bacterium]
MILRHGDKELTGHDPNLSQKGQTQALHFCEKVKAGRLPAPTALLVSTKKRTYQTLQPLSDTFKIPLTIKAELTERVPGESVEKFRKRIQEFLVKLMLFSQDRDVIYMCTHFDWIDEFLTVIECESDLSRCNHWPPAQHMVFEKRDLWYLTKYEGV